jgi:hypothetical protein
LQPFVLSWREVFLLQCQKPGEKKAKTNNMRRKDLFPRISMAELMLLCKTKRKTKAGMQGKKILTSLKKQKTLGDVHQF